MILVGGLGTRLGRLTDKVPKPMLPIDGRPFLDYQLSFLNQSGVTDVVMCVGHLAEVVQARYGVAAPFGMHVVFSHEPSPAGTGGALVLARSHLAETFFVLNGDTILDLDLLGLEAALAEDTSMLGAIALRQVPNAEGYGRVSTEAKRVTGFAEKTSGGPGLINGGVYCLKTSALDLLPPPPCSLERDLFPILAGKGQLLGKNCNGYFIDIGLPETLARAAKELPVWINSRAGRFVK
ncbi:MAG: nucleotidyltransferase family protein [Verrucomicrobiota bacterium]